MLVHGLNFTPEITGIAPYTSKMAIELANHGFDVDVITGFPHYPQWKRQAGYGGFSETDRIENARLFRVWHFVPRKPTAVRRALLEISFGLSSVLAIRRRYDAVICVSPALISSIIVLTWLSLFSRGCRSVVWFQDLYGVGLNEVGAAKASRLAGVFSWLESRLARSAAGVVVIHPRFLDVLSIEPGMRAAGRAVVIKNWTHVSSIPDVGADGMDLRSRFGLEPSSVLVGHFGNMGRKQSLDSVIAAAKLADLDQGLRPVHFILVGDGSERGSLQEKASGLRTVHFVDSFPDSEFLSAMKAVDFLLVNESAGVKEMCVPSKLTSYYAAGRPIVAATNDDSLTSLELLSSGVGEVVAPEDPAALLACVRKLAQLDRTHDSSPVAIPREAGSAKLAVEEMTALLSRI